MGDQRAIIHGNGPNNTLTSLRFDGAASSNTAEWLVTDLRFNRIEGDAIRIVGLSTDDHITIDHIDVQMCSSAVDPMLNFTGVGSGVYFAATPSGSLGRFEITNSYFYQNEGPAIVVNSAAQNPAPATAKSLIESDIIGYVPNSLLQVGNGVNSPGIQLGKGAANIEIEGCGIYTTNKAAIQQANAGPGIEIHFDFNHTGSQTFSHPLTPT